MRMVVFMCKSFHMCTCFLCAVVIMFAAVYPVSATSNLEDQGFVEYQVDASINFEEVIEVTLQDQETGEIYKHQLYRVNDYAANFSVSFGVYTVSAEVLSMNSGQVVSDAVATCLTELIAVDNASIAVPVDIRIDEFAVGDVSETYAPVSNLESNGTEPSDEATVPDDSQIENDTEPSEMTTPDDAYWKPKDPSNARRSAVVSFVISLGIIGAAGLYVRYRKNQ